jgi:large subunit ribosomal protein L1
MKRSKAYRAAAEAIDQDTLYSPAEAVSLVRKTATTKYDATIEVALRLGVDPRKADQMVRGTVNLPNGTGKTARVLVFATGRPRAAGPRRPARTTWAATTCSSASRAAGSTSTPSSPPPT